MKLVHGLSLVLLAGALQLSTGTGFAATASDVVLGFGASYRAPDATTCVHRGMDVAARAGEPFEAPVAGVVRFAGSVPGPHGGRVKAVTLDTAEGKVSMMPFEEIEVEAGEPVPAGGDVGTVAQSGDPSSAGVHVHVSLRHDDLYVDPSVLLAEPAVAEPPETGTEPVTVDVPDTGGAETAAPETASSDPADVRTSTTAGGPVVVGVSPVGAKAPVTSGSGSGVTVAGTSAVQGDSPVAEADTGVSLAGAGAGSVGAGGAAGDPFSEWRDLLGGLSRRTAAFARGLAGAVVPVTATLAAVIALSVYLLGRRSFERRLRADSPVSGRLGTLLQQLRAGDTLRGLTSCSGPLPSQSRGRTVQRR